MNRFFLCLLATVGLLAATVRAAEIESVTHEALEKKTAVTVKTTGRLKIVLPGRGNPGHEWRIVSNDPRIIRPSTTLRRSGDTNNDGTWEISFIAQRPGRSIVRFVWAKAGETDVASPEETREVTVRVESLF